MEGGGDGGEWGEKRGVGSNLHRLRTSDFVPTPFSTLLPSPSSTSLYFFFGFFIC